ncbi:MAG TPA: YraN family protein [Steroidobacteraceae bacterium]|nr:YraN family protein [Steroidobacteraceae bacterium]
MAPSGRRLAGDAAENLVLDHLSRAGLKLLTRNYRCRAGELDLVLLEGNQLVLVEVRYRSGTSHGGAIASVSSSKQRRLVQAARHLLMQYPELARLPARFDVVAVEPAGAGPRRLTWLRSAFELPAS